MNYDQARQVALGDDALGGWHWTTMRGGVVRPAMPCRLYVGPVRSVADMMREPVKGTDFETCPPHATKEEAERHFYDYSLEQVDLERYSNWQDCVICGEPTKMGLGNKGMSLYFQGSALCVEHLSREHLASKYPFEPGIELIHS